MKIFGRYAVVALAAVSLLVACGRKSQPMSQTVRAAMPASHSLDFDRGFIALDLEHGLGSTQLTLKRRWSGATGGAACLC